MAVRPPHCLYKGSLMAAAAPWQSGQRECPSSFSTPITDGGASWPWAASTVLDGNVPHCHLSLACLALHSTDISICSVLPIRCSDVSVLFTEEVNPVPTACLRAWDPCASRLPAGLVPPCHLPATRPPGQADGPWAEAGDVVKQQEQIWARHEDKAHEHGQLWDTRLSRAAEIPDPSAPLA